MQISDLTRSPATSNPLLTNTALSDPKRTQGVDDTSVSSTIRAVDAFRQELRTSITAKFFARFAPVVPAYDASASDTNADSVARETLGAAQQLVDQAPTRGARSIISFRSTVSESAQYLREALGARADIGDIDLTEGLINQGLTAIAARAENNVDATTSVLSIRSKITDSSSIRIKTQDGDEVNVRIVNIDALQARDAAFEDADGSVTRTSVSFRETNTVRVQIDGDIDDDEQAAIQSVIDQASAIADEFFGGDIAAAFNNAEQFAFDQEQLSLVNLRFKSTETTQASYAQSTTQSPVTPTPVAQQPITPQPAPSPALPPEAAAPILPIENVALKSAKEIPDALIFTPPTNAGTTTDDAAPIADAEAPAAPAAPAAATDDNPLRQFFELVSSFLDSTRNGFDSANGQDTLFFREGFKLSLLRETIVVSAPESAQTAAETAAAAIDQFAAEDAQDTA